MFEETMAYERLKQVVEEIKRQIEEEFSQGRPYAVVRLRAVRAMLGGIRGISYIIKCLRIYYGTVIRDGNWIIVLNPRHNDTERKSAPQRMA